MLSLIFTKYFCRNEGDDYVELWYRGYPIGSRDVTNFQVFVGEGRQEKLYSNRYRSTSQLAVVDNSLSGCFRFIVPWPDRMKTFETKIYLPGKTQANWHGFCYSVSGKHRESKISNSVCQGMMRASSP